MVDMEFAARLARACDDLPTIIPPYGSGRLVVLAKKMKVSQEACRRWFAGEARPRVAKMQELATLLNVDAGWLSLGVEPDMRPVERAFFSRQVEGVTHVALGLALLEGAACAKPDDQDPRREYLDFYMMMAGKQIPIRASLGREMKVGEYEFVVPREYERVKNVGFVYAPHHGARMQMLDLATTLITKHREHKGSDFTVTVKHRGDKYMTGRDEWSRVKTFGELA